MDGLVHIYEGDGKGKSTAAIGLSIRCAGSGGDVLFTQFLKNNSSSELKIFDQIDRIHLLTCNQSFGFISQMTQEQKKEAEAFYRNHFQKVMKEIQSKSYRMLVLDEILAAYNHEMIERRDLITFIQSKPPTLEVVLTGREPADELIQLADYVSRIVKIKHPYDRGIGARVGIER